MAKFLVKASYTAEGVKGLLQSGASSRKAAVGSMIEGLGGKLESIYYCLGGDDVVVIADMPDTITAVALSMAVNASGAVTLSTTALLSIEEMDAACKKSVDYRPPGS